MATIQELFRSRPTTEGDDPSIDFNYLIKGTNSDLTAKLTLDTLTAAEYDGLVKESLSIEVLGLDSWRGTVRYSKRKKKEHGDSRYNFDTRGATQHVTQALEVIGVYVPAGENAPDFHGTIGGTPDGVEGLDIVLPQFSFSETHYLSAAWVNEAYKHNVYYLTGQVNASIFRGKARGEALFEGATGSRTGDGLDDLWEITFYFRASPNATNLAIGPNIVVPAKEGWQYLDVHYEQTIDTFSTRLVMRPYAAQLARLYEYGNFSVLGIG
jgi:hypothetical protein